MALLRKLFFQKPPDGLLEISERVYGAFFSVFYIVSLFLLSGKGRNGFEVGSNGSGKLRIVEWGKFILCALSVNLAFRIPTFAFLRLRPRWVAKKMRKKKEYDYVIFFLLFSYSLRKQRIAYLHSIEPNSSPFR